MLIPCPGWAAARGPVARRRDAQAVPALDRLASLVDAVEVVPDPGPGPVLPREGGDYVNVIRGVPDRDPAHRIIVVGPRQARPVHDLFRDPCPLRIGENRIVRGGPCHAMPNRLAETASAQSRERLIQQSVEPPEVPLSVDPGQWL
jgi:hypothetical protein